MLQKGFFTQAIYFFSKKVKQEIVNHRTTIDNKLITKNSDNLSKSDKLNTKLGLSKKFMTTPINQQPTQEQLEEQKIASYASAIDRPGMHIKNRSYFRKYIWNEENPQSNCSSKVPGWVGISSGRFKLEDKASFTGYVIHFGNTDVKLLCVGPTILAKTVEQRENFWPSNLFTTGRCAAALLLPSQENCATDYFSKHEAYPMHPNLRTKDTWHAMAAMFVAADVIDGNSKVLKPTALLTTSNGSTLVLKASWLSTNDHSVLTENDSEFVRALASFNQGISNCGELLTKHASPNHNVSGLDTDSVDTNNRFGVDFIPESQRTIFLSSLGNEIETTYYNVRANFLAHKIGVWQRDTFVYRTRAVAKLQANLLDDIDAPDA